MTFKNTELPRLDRGIYVALDMTGYRGQAAGIWHLKKSSIKNFGIECTYTYLIGSEQSKQAIFVVPVLDNISVYIELIHHYQLCLAACHKTIDAVGFKKRNSVVIGEFEQINYNHKLGIIAPGLFGLGIAYSEVKSDPFGNEEHQVGLFKFMVYLNKIIPVWLKYHL